jgi:hypothetical protein
MFSRDLGRALLATTSIISTAGVAHAAITPSGSVWRYNRPGNTWTALSPSTGSQDIAPDELWAQRNTGESASLDIGPGSNLAAGDIYLGTNGAASLAMSTDPTLRGGRLFGDDILFGGGATIRIDLANGYPSIDWGRPPRPDLAIIKASGKLNLSFGSKIIVNGYSSADHGYADYYTIATWIDQPDLWYGSFEFKLPAGWSHGRYNNMVFVRTPTPGALSLFAVAGLSLSSRRRR